MCGLYVINDIKRFRSKYRLSQQQLADMLQVNQASISLWERGAKPSGPAGILLGILIELEYHPYALRQLFETVGLPRIPNV